MSVLTRNEVAERIFEKLNEPYGEKIDSGGYGTVYNMRGNKVLKITEDSSEAKAANKLVGKNMEYVVDYYMVKSIWFPAIQGDLSLGYMIIMEQVNNKIPPKIKSYIADVIYILEDFNISYNRDLPNMKEDVEKDILNRLNKESSKRIYYNIKNIFVELNKYGLKFTDFNVSNLGIKNGHLVAFDLRGYGGLLIKDKIKV